MQTRSCIYLLLLSLFILPAKAQTFEKLIGEQEWHIIETLEGFVAGNSDETFVLYEIPKQGFGILLFNNKGQVKWKTALKEKPFNMARIENNIVILTGDKTGYSAGTNHFNAVLLNPENGKILAEKNILSADNSVLVVPVLYGVKSGKFAKIGLRYTNSSRGIKVLFFGAGLGKAITNYNQVSKMEIVSVDKTLAISAKQQLLLPADILYAGSDMDDDGNVLFAGYQEDSKEVIVYHFPEGKNTADKKIPVSVKAKKTESIKEMQLLAGRQQASVCYFATSYKNEDKDYVYEINRIDFQSGNKTMVSDVLDKKYRKSLEAQPFNAFKNIRKPDVDDINDLTLTNIIEAGDKLIVCKDIQRVEMSGQSNTVMYAGGNGIISVYDAGFKKLYERVIPKKYKSYLPLGLGIDLHAKDEFAYFITNDSEAGYMKAEVLFGKMEISTGNILFIEHLAKDDIGKNEPADMKNVIWYKDKLALSYMKLKSMFSWNYTSIPVIYKY